MFDAEKEPKSFSYYLNPILWIRSLSSYVMTFLLFFNRFFAIIFGIFVIAFVAWFFYDRYSNFTYGEEESVSRYKIGIFAKKRHYDSPLAGSDPTDVSDKLSGIKTAKKVKDKKAKEQQEEQLKEQEKTSPSGKKKTKRKSKKKGSSQRPYSSIQNEVRRRMANEKNN